MSIICAVTGCAFVNSDGSWVSGDLFQSADGTWIFNGNVEVFDDGRIASAWQQTEETFYKKSFTATEWWTRRGVFVFDKDAPVFNEAIRDYLRETP